MHIVCLDLESVLIPEIWVTIANITNIEELYLTTRDVANYEVLMNKRLEVLRRYNLKLEDLLKIIETIRPLNGALPFLEWLRHNFPTIILTDSFSEFVKPLAKKLKYPTFFSNFLEIDKQGYINNYIIRLQNGKERTVKTLKTLRFETIAIGDSYNDIEMLKEADIGILFNPSKTICENFPDLPVVDNYMGLKQLIKKWTLSSNK